jgi:hypothetical protein
MPLKDTFRVIPGGRAGETPPKEVEVLDPKERVRKAIEEAFTELKKLHSDMKNPDFDLWMIVEDAMAAGQNLTTDMQQIQQTMDEE